MYHVHACYLRKPEREGIGPPGTEVYRWLWAAMWVLGIEHKPSRSTASALGDLISNCNSPHSAFCSQMSPSCKFEAHFCTALVPNCLFFLRHSFISPRLLWTSLYNWGMTLNLASLAPTSSVRVLQDTPSHVPLPVYVVLGSKLRALCTLGKHFVSCAVSPAPLLYPLFFLSPSSVSFTYLCALLCSASCSPC